MSTIEAPEKDHFWRRYYRKFTDISHKNRTKKVRHHSLRRWKNVQKPQNIVEPIALGYWSTFSSKTKSPMPLLSGKRSVSGVAMTPGSSCIYHGRDSLSPQSYTTAESTLPNNEPRSTLDPGEDITLRHSTKSERFQTQTIVDDDDMEPSFYLGIANKTKSGTTSASMSSADGETSENSHSFESLVNSFDWYATNVFKKLETSVLSLMTYADNDMSKCSAITDSFLSPSFNDAPLCSTLTPCTGAATQKDYAIDQAIYGHHAKCFI